MSSGETYGPGFLIVIAFLAFFIPCFMLVRSAFEDDVRLTSTRKFVLGTVFGSVAFLIVMFHPWIIDRIYLGILIYAAYSAGIAYAARRLRQKWESKSSVRE